MWKSADRAPFLRVLPLAFALQLRKKHGKPSVGVRNRNLSQGKKRNDVTWLAGVKCLAVYLGVERKITKNQADRCLGRVSKRPLY
jgi:hypothetical protein